MAYVGMVNEPCQEAKLYKECLFCFWTSGVIQHVIPQVDRSRNKDSALPTLFVSLPSSCFLRPHISSLHASCFLILILSLFIFLTGRHILHLLLSFRASFFPLCVCLCVFNGSTCLLMPGESLTWRFLLMNQTPLIEHGCLCNDITHAFTHTMAIP